LTVRDQLDGALELVGNVLQDRQFASLGSDLEPISANEYVAAYDFGLPVVTIGDQILPAWIDDLSRDVREDVYEVMETDPKVHSCLWKLILGILNGGLHIMPDVEYSDDNSTDYTSSEERAQLATQMLNNLETPFLTEVAPDLLRCILSGNKIAEVTYHKPGEGPKPTKHWIKSIKPKSRRAVAFVVDNFNNVAGFTSVNTVVKDDAGSGVRKFRLIPKDKFVWISWKPTNSDPRGSSDGRSIYDPWVKKIQFIQEYVKFGAQFGSPSLVGNTAEGASIRPQQDPRTGEIILGADGMPLMVDPANLMKNALLTFRNGSVLILPFGAKVEAMRPQYGGEVFEKAIDRWDAEIEVGMTLQGAGSSQGDVAQDYTGLAIAFGKQVLAYAIRERLLRPWTEMNYGPEVEPPLVTLTGVEPQDFARDSEAVARLHGSGYIDPTQYAQTDVRLGFKPRRLSPEDIATMRENQINPQPPALTLQRGQSGQDKPGTRVANNPPKPGNKRPKNETSGQMSTKDVNLLTPPNPR
jgi:hypothetical protein